MKALLPLFQVPLIEPGKGLSMILWSNTAIQTRKTNRDGQEMGLVQLLRTADHHNDIVVGTKKNSNKMLDSCFPSAFRMNCFSLLLLLYYLRRERGRDGLQLCKRLLVFKTYGNYHCDTVRLILSKWAEKGKLFTHYITNVMPLHALRVEASHQCSSGSQGKVYVLKDAGCRVFLLVYCWASMNLFFFFRLAGIYRAKAQAETLTETSPYFKFQNV